MLQCRHIDEWLEGRTRLTNGHAGTVEAVLAASADHSQDMTGFRVNRNNCCLRLQQAVFIPVIIRQMTQCPYSSMLFFSIHRRIDFQAFFVESIIAVFSSNLL